LVPSGRISIAATSQSPVRCKQATTSLLFRAVTFNNKIEGECLELL
jgi:hypothetical protein